MIENGEGKSVGVSIFPFCGLPHLVFGLPLPRESVFSFRRFLERLSGRTECDQKSTNQYEKERDGLLPEELFPEQQSSGNKGDNRAAAPQDRDDGDGGTGDGNGAKVEIIGNDQEDAGGDDGPAESEGGRGFSRRAGGDRSNEKNDAVQDAETG